MKKVNCIYVFLCLLSLSCSKQGEYTMPFMDNISLSNTILLNSGTFSSTSGITVSGGAETRRQNNDFYIKLVNFSITSGPDLKVYLSKNEYPSEFLHLGALEDHKIFYQIPSGVVIDNYSYVLIYCQQYNHLFAVAKLN